MITNIITQDFSNFATQVKENNTRQRLDVLADYYTSRISDNQTKLIEQYAEKLVENPAQTVHTPDPRLYMRRDLLNLVQDSFALGQSEGFEDVQKMFANYNSTVDTSNFALSDTPEQKLEKNINSLKREIEKSEKINRTSNTLKKYRNTIKALDSKAQKIGTPEQQQQIQELTQKLQQLEKKTGLRSIKQQIVQGLKPYNTLMEKADAEKMYQEEALLEEDPYDDEGRLKPYRPITVKDYMSEEDYLIKRAIESKLEYLETRKQSLENTPPISLQEDKDFFRWYSQKRLVPIANRYQDHLENKNEEVKSMLTKYTQQVGGSSIAASAKGEYVDKITNKLLNIEEKIDKDIKKQEDIANRYPGSKKVRYKRDQSPIKRVQRVVATELAIAYNIGRLKAYMKAGIQYVTISTSMYSDKPCTYCLDTEEKTKNNPISIASLLKKVYKNEGFNKNLDRPVENRYLVSHPYCYCHYKPHPRRDPENKVESAGVYSDPNSWRFILGAGLGVSLVFLAFALTSGRKIAAPVKAPTPPLPVKVTIPDIVSPPSTTVKQLTPNVRPAVGLELRFLLEDLADIPLTPKQRSVVKLDLEDILAKNQGNLESALSDVEDLLSKVKTPEYAKDVLDTIATKRGLEKELYYARYAKLYNQYTKTLSAQPDIDRLANRVESYVNPQTGAAITRAANNIEKSRVDKKIKPLSLLRQDLQKALATTDDPQYKAGLQERITQLDSFIATLENQKLQLDNVRANIFVVNKAVINQRITALQALVDRLENNKDLLEEAVTDYEDLLEMLVTLPEKDLAKYVKAQTDLKRRIQKARGIELKKFMHHTADFTTSPSCKYSVSPRSLLFSIYHRINTVSYKYF